MVQVTRSEKTAKSRRLASASAELALAHASTAERVPAARPATRRSAARSWRPASRLWRNHTTRPRSTRAATVAVRGERADQRGPHPYPPGVIPPR